MFFFTFPYFNSIKVQLELVVDEHLLSGSEFQFHKGTIRTVEAGDT